MQPVGWYLAVCFMFNGHNNETGGAGRIEEFKGFVRVCLRKDSLTVYVIGVDRPQRKGIRSAAENRGCVHAANEAGECRTGAPAAVGLAVGDWGLGIGA